MTKRKEAINWYYTIVGVLLLAGYFYPKNSAISDNDLSTKQITLSRNVEFLKAGSKSKSFHRLCTKETKAAFIINEPGGIATNWIPLDSLVQGDSLIIKYHSKRDSDLENESEEIPIYFLQKKDRLYFDTNHYNQSKEIHDFRWNTITLIIGGLLVLRGLTVISTKLTFIFGAVALLSIIILRLSNKF